MKKTVKNSPRYARWQSLRNKQLEMLFGFDDAEQAQKMKWHEFGTGRIPRRPLFFLFAARNKSKAAQAFSRALRAFLDSGSWAVGQSEAEAIKADARRIADESIPPPLSPNTPKSPRISPHPLLRTGEMIGSIRSVFRVGQRRR
jgi:hypothetical protein